VHGLNKLTSQSQPEGSGCSASTSEQTYDANGNVASRNDFDGYRACYSHDQSRNVELVRVEGLAGTARCDDATGSGAALPSGSRKLTTQWHPDWRLKTKVAEPGRRTTYVYQGQDPLNTGTPANCAGAGVTLPTLPDNKPLALLCQQVEQATTDANGSQGFNAALLPGAPARVRSWTYNEHGQVLTEKDPLNNTTTYEYYPSTDFPSTDPNAEGHTQGDLKQVTNAAGHVTQYTKYNRHGQVLETKDPNNVTTSFTYDLRQRLLSTNVGGRTTTYSYWPTGLLNQVTQPDGSYTIQEYDGAHRLRVIRDNLGNRIEYDLDAAGNRKAETVTDPQGALRRQVSRVFDALGRLEKTTGRE
jgi:YD repeat-containing protein